MQTFDDRLSLWLQAHAFGRRPATLRFNAEIARCLRLTCPDHLATPAADLTEAAVIGIGTRLAHYSPARWNALVGALRFISPLARILPKRRLQLREFNPPTQAQFAALLAACDANPRSHAGLVVRFLAFTGLRISEARALTWADVREDRIVVPGRITKSGRPRAVPIVPALRNALDGLRRVGAAGGCPDTILPRSTPRKAIRSACAAVGLPLLSFHAFRHWFATRTIEGGVPVPTVARWLGHSDGGALLGRTYFHLGAEHGSGAEGLAGAALGV